MERFKRFQFSVPAVPLQKGFFYDSVQFHRTVPVPVSVPGKRLRRFRFLPSVSGKTVPTVPVSGSGAFLEPPCLSGSLNHVPCFSASEKHDALRHPKNIRRLTIAIPIERLDV